MVGYKQDFWTFWLLNCGIVFGGGAENITAVPENGRRLNHQLYPVSYLAPWLSGPGVELLTCELSCCVSRFAETPFRQRQLLVARWAGLSPWPTVHAAAAAVVWQVCCFSGGCSSG